MWPRRPAPDFPSGCRAGTLAAILPADVTGLGFDAVAINGSGQVAGTLNGRAVLWTAGAGTQDLGTLGGASSRGYAINESGQVAGSSTTATGATHAFLWTPGQGMRDLGTLPTGTASTARGINDRGQVVGESTLPPSGAIVDPPRHAFLWSPDQGMQDLGAIGQPYTWSVAYDINNGGQVVGRSFSPQRVFPPTDPELFSRAFLWTPGQGMQDLGALSGGFSIALAINDAGTVVGRSWVSRPSAMVYHAFRWSAGAGMQDLGAFAWSSDSSIAHGINNAGQIVGMSKVGTGPWTASVAFIWTESEGLENLSPTTGIGTALAINDHQQVVGDGRVARVHLAPGNIPPVAYAGGPYTGTEGADLEFEPAGRDQDGGRLFGNIRYGDSQTDIIDGLLPYLWRTVKHRYADNDVYVVTVVVSDDRGGQDVATTTATIANVAPTILAGSLTGPANPIPLTSGSASALIAFEFMDPAGIHDVYVAEVSCGNGLVLRPTNIPVSSQYSTKGAYAGACTYTSAGIYTVRVTVADEDGGVSPPAFYRYVVVYDPDGASTTGTGFYAVTSQAKGKAAKAHFTFDAWFPPGSATVPNGTVTFRILGGDMSFESTAIEMLVVSGNRAQFWGTGVLNGAPVRFRITAVDGKAGGNDGSVDAIRVEIRDATGAAVLYDTQPGAAQDAAITTPTGGGQIRIRSG